MLLRSAIVLAAILSTLPAVAAWPERPVRILVPYAAGGNTDGIARLVAAPLSEAFGQQFVVENRVGANGVVAADATARAAPDGYTLMMAAVGQFAISPAMGKVPYDPAKDFAPVSIVATNPFVLVASRGLPAATLPELVAYAQARPGQLNYASGGVGSVGHLSAALLIHKAGLRIEHVSYRGGAPALADVLAGQIPMVFANLSEAVPHANSGAVRLLAVTSGARAPQLPEVPTVAESGFPGFETITWNGIVAPAKTPPATIERLALELRKIVGIPANAERFASLGVDPAGSTPQEFAETIARDIPVWAEAVRAAGAKLE